ncbi:small multi-drug export protein [Candidatus Woesearchaeota archaeon]|nr:small multi-drug export protein [Candidatus Woesearchaeota archaeon]
MDPLLQSIILSMLPIAELRGGIPLAIYNGVHPVLAFVVCVAANFAIVPLVYLFLDYIHHHLLVFSWYKRGFDHFLERARRKTHHYVEKYGYLGLAIFVAIPLPMTGAYTGTLAAWFFEMNKKKAFLAIACGVVVAGLVVTMVVLGGVKALDIFIKIVNGR